MTPATESGAQLGYARVSTGHQSLDQQLDALTAAGVDPERIYRDKLSGTSTREQRPGLAALLDYGRPGDAIVVVGIDRLGRNAAEVMTTIRELRDRETVLRSLREGIDTSNATGRMFAGVLASLAELELELGRERRAAAKAARRARGMPIGRPRKLSPDRNRPPPLHRPRGAERPFQRVRREAQSLIADTAQRGYGRWRPVRMATKTLKANISAQSAVLHSSPHWWTHHQLPLLATPRVTRVANVSTTRAASTEMTTPRLPMP